MIPSPGGAASTPRHAEDDDARAVLGGQPGGPIAALAALVAAHDERDALRFDAALAAARKALDGGCADHDPPYAGLVADAPMIDRLRMMAGALPHGVPTADDPIAPGSPIARVLNQAANALELLMSQRTAMEDLAAAYRSRLGDDAGRWAEPHGAAAP